MIHVATQHRRQVRVHDRGVAAGDELHQRADLVRRGHLREADASRQVCQPQLVIRIAIAMHEHDRAGAHACSERRAQFSFGRAEIERPARSRRARRALVDFDHRLVQHRRQFDAPHEEFRPMLIADAQRVARSRA